MIRTGTVVIGVWYFDLGVVIILYNPSHEWVLNLKVKEFISNKIPFFTKIIVRPKFVLFIKV